MAKYSTDYASKLILMALRCDYVRIQGGHLTKEGKGRFSPRMWHIINEFKCFFNHKWTADLAEVILDIIKAEETRHVIKSLGLDDPLTKLNVALQDEQAN